MPGSSLIGKIVAKIWPPARRNQAEMEKPVSFSLRDDKPAVSVSNREKIRAQILVRTPSHQFIEGLAACGFNPKIVRRMRKRRKNTRVSSEDLLLLQKLNARPEHLQNLEQLRCEQIGSADPYGANS